jgi:hypothetical protein
VITPRAQPAGKLGAPLSKAEVFSRAAPATLILIAEQDNRWNSALGVVVSPQGAVVSDTRLLNGIDMTAEKVKGKIHGFLYDPSLSSDDDPLLFLRAHPKEALPLLVVRSEPTTHLLMLQLPPPAPKKPYYFLDTQDTQGVTVGLDVVTLRTRGRQTLALGVGSIAAMRPGSASSSPPIPAMLELEPALVQDNAGGPVLSQSGRLLAISTYSDKALNASGQGRPVELIRELLAGKLGAAPVEPSKDDKPPPVEAPAESRNAVEAVRIGLGTALGLKLDKQQALLLQSEFISAMGQRGRLVLRDIDSVELLNGIIKALVKGSDPKGRVVSELFPQLMTDKKGIVWVKAGTTYRPVPGANGGLAAVDDLTGALYAVDAKRQVLLLDEVSSTWRVSPLAAVADLRASGGTLFALLQDGRIIAADRDAKNSRQLFPRSLKDASLDASQGVLYVITADGEVYRYRNKKWDQKTQPIAYSMKRMIVRGENWFGMDKGGRIFSSGVQRYIDRDGNIDRLWGVGRDLLVLSREGNRFYYNAGSDTWGPWPHW